MALSPNWAVSCLLHKSYASLPHHELSTKTQGVVCFRKHAKEVLCSLVTRMSKRQRSDDETSSSDDNTQDEDNKGNKYLHIDTSSQNHKPVIYCSLAPHARSLPFLSYEDYEIHYLKDHSNRCSDCNKNFPTQHFLQLHIGENHDPINEARRAKGEKTVDHAANLSKSVPF